MSRLGCLIGIDVGTTATKAVLLDLSGRRIAQFARPHPMHRPAPGEAEQDPADWMAGVMGALHAFADKVEGGEVLGIGITSQVNTHVFTDAAGTPVMRAITWQDVRAASDAATLDATVTADEKLRWFGAPIPIDASHALSRLAWLRRVHPDRAARVRHILLPKDYCIAMLTGAMRADGVAAIGLANAGGYVADLLERVPGAAAMLPPLGPFTEIAGRVRPGLPFAGVPVVIGAMDAWAGMFGVGVVDDGDAMYQSGTSEIPGLVSSRVKPTPGVIVFPPYEGIVMHAAPTQSGGAAVAWGGALLGRSPVELIELAETASPSEAVPLFLPHMSGERAPLWDSATRGVFARLEGRTGPPELARAVLEGVGQAVRWAFAALSQSGERQITIANLGGGGARSDFYAQLRADCLGMALKRCSVFDAAAVGAAILAGVGTGTMSSLRQAARGLVHFDRTFEPNPRLRSYYDDRYGHYRALYDTLKPFNARY